MISQEDRARIAELAMLAVDEIIERHGDDATLEDALLVWEVSYPDPEHEYERLTEVSARCTSHRAIVAGGLAMTYALSQVAPWERND